MVRSHGLRLGAPCLLLLLLAQPGYAQKEGQGILRGLIDNLTPDTPEQMEGDALATRDATEALKRYGSLLARHPDSPEGVRAALWIGLYYYGAGDVTSALEYFERGRKHAKDPGLRSRAEFWCDAARLAAGVEPLPDGSDGDRRNAWDSLRGLVRADRSIRAGRPGEAEQLLLSLEGDARRGGLLGVLAARWGTVLASGAPGRGGREGLRPLRLAIAGLPEEIYFQDRAEPPPPAPAGDETWSIQFGAFLEEDNAKEMRKELEREGCDARIDEEDEEGRHWYRVREGEMSTRAAAESLAAGAADQSGFPTKSSASDDASACDDPDDGAVSRGQGPAPRHAPSLPDGRLLRDLLRGRAHPLEDRRDHAHIAELRRPGADPPRRISLAQRRTAHPEALEGGAARGDLRAGGGPGRRQGTRRAQGRGGSEPRHDRLRAAPRPRQEQLPRGALRGRRTPSGWPRPTSRRDRSSRAILRRRRRRRSWSACRPRRFWHRKGGRIPASIASCANTSGSRSAPLSTDGASPPPGGSRS